MDDDKMVIMERIDWTYPQACYDPIGTRVFLLDIYPETENDEYMVIFHMNDNKISKYSCVGMYDSQESD